MSPDLTAGSPVWQIAFVSFAAVLILFEVVRGWRLGLLRQAMRIAAVLAAYAAAIFGGNLFVPLVRPILKMPDVVLSALAGVILAALVYSGIASLGTILFKRTGQQGSSVMRLIYGSTGAFVGLFFGAFFVWLILMGIRSIGAIADAQAHTSASASGVRNSAAIAPHSHSADGTPSLSALDSDSVVTLLARLKNSMELGSLGDAVRKADVIPAGIYRTLSDVGTVFANPQSAQRFLTFPGVKELGENPKIVALRSDPEIAEMVSEGRFFELMRDPRIIDAVNDPDLIAQIKRFDLQRALDYAAKKN